MKAVLPLALLGALAVVGTAYAAGSGEVGKQSQSTMSGSQSSAAGKSAQHQKWSQKQVQDIQNKLKEQGYEVGQVDGKFGPTTRQALRQFQADKGINSSGSPDAQTLAALDLGSGVQTGQMPGASRPTPPASGGDQGGSSPQNQQPPAGSGVGGDASQGGTNPGPSGQ
jgi:peptidoglycan hydrolase-like protein with peptidoglycan-binding domain